MNVRLVLHLTGLLKGVQRSLVVRQRIDEVAVNGSDEPQPPLDLADMRIRPAGKSECANGHGGSTIEGWEIAAKEVCLSRRERGGGDHRTARFDEQIRSANQRTG